MLTSSSSDLKSNESIATALNDFRAKSSMSKTSITQETRSQSKEKQKPCKSNTDLNSEASQLLKNNKILEEKVIGTMLSIKKLKNISKELKQKELEIESLEKELAKAEQTISKKKKKLNWFEETLNALFTHCSSNSDEGILKLFNSSKSKKSKLKSPRKSLSIEDFALKSISSRAVKTTKHAALKSPNNMNGKLLTVSNKKSKKGSKPGSRVQAFTPSVKLKSFEKSDERSSVMRLKLEHLFMRTKNILDILNTLHLVQ